MFETRPDVKAKSSFWSSSKFQEARISSSREREQELGVSFRPEISVPPTRCSSNERVPVGRSSAYTRLLFHAVNLSA